MRPAALALLGVVVLAAAGCQQRSLAVPSTATIEVDHAAEGRKAFERQDWGSAATHFRIALEKSPDDLGLHYGLAISASWLDARDEAVQEFQWVLAHAASGSDESRVAREWLAGAAGRGVAGGARGRAPERCVRPWQGNNLGATRRRSEDPVRHGRGCRGPLAGGLDARPTRGNFGRPGRGVARPPGRHQRRSLRERLADQGSRRRPD